MLFQNSRGDLLCIEHSNCRQVLECEDGVRGVTALALVEIAARQLAAGAATSTESGDSEDSFAAVQDARAWTTMSTNFKIEFVRTRLSALLSCTASSGR